MSKEQLDDFSDLSVWTAIASGQACLTISPDHCPSGDAMRLDFDFHGGGGFVVARRSYTPTLPESYVFSFDLCGQGLSNIFEFKLVDSANQNVWRWRREVFDLTADWQTIQIKSSEMQFAWGPLGGGPACDIAAIELVIAAGPGGQGTVRVGNLRFEDTSYYLTPVVSATHALPGYEPQAVLDPSRSTGWRSASTKDPQQLTLDFQQEREYGGLTIVWDPERRPASVNLELSSDGVLWKSCFSTDQGVGRETHVYLPGASSRFVRMTLKASASGLGLGVVFIEVQPYAFSKSMNDFFSSIARCSEPGLYPKYLLGHQTYWTPVGTGEDVTQALFNEEGMVEVDQGSFSIEPFLYAEGHLISWADAVLKQTLERGDLPIPSSEWSVGRLLFKSTAFATGPEGSSSLFVRYCITNRSDQAMPVTLFAAIRPFQVTPTWQNWDRFGGVSPIHELAYERGSVRVDQGKRVIPLTAPSQFGAATFAQGPISEYLRAGTLPQQQSVNDSFGYASGALRFDLSLEPKETREVYLAVPFGSADAMTMNYGSGAEQFQLAVSQWASKLDGFDIRLPPSAAGVVETLKTCAAHILINRAGPALHPGPRRYSRSWIRDGVLMGAALARIGRIEAGRDFIRWYAAYQKPDGNLPDCADRVGCEWLPEFDCWGQHIFAVMDYYRFSGDRPFLVEMWPSVLKSVNYMDGLRKQRMTPEYQTGEKQACYGLLPESMSHEGYMAHPVHAYWDDFWAVRGLKDAAEMAGLIGENEQSKQISARCEDFRTTLEASLNRVIQKHGLDFVPGSVEFADFDPSATSVAISVVDELHRLPHPAIEQTYEKYLIGFRKRASGEVPWANYSAYEIRIIGALTRLGRRQEAQELLQFFLADRRLLAWNQWPEISWNDPLSPSFIGDMPHSWIGAEYILAIRSLFAYEREADQSLVLAAGVSQEWLDHPDGVVVHHLPTFYGPLSYRLRKEDSRTVRVSVEGGLRLPAGGLVIQPPWTGPLVQVTVNGVALPSFSPDGVRCVDLPAEILFYGEAGNA